MEEENGKQESQGEQKEELLAGKFKSVDALVRAYGELEAEFTRRSQRLRALEDERKGEGEGAHPVMDGEALYDAVTKNESVRARVLGEYLDSLKGVPLLAGSGAGVTAPAVTPKTISEASALALGYFKNQKS